MKLRRIKNGLPPQWVSCVPLKVETVLQILTGTSLVASFPSPTPAFHDLDRSDSRSEFEETSDSGYPEGEKVTAVNTAEVQRGDAVGGGSTGEAQPSSVTDIDEGSTPATVEIAGEGNIGLGVDAGLGLKQEADATSRDGGDHMKATAETIVSTVSSQRTLCQ